MADFVVGFLTGVGSGGGLGAVQAVREGLPIGAVSKLLDARNSSI